MLGIPPSGPPIASPRDAVGGTPVACCPTYSGTQQLVDYLGSAGFPIRHLTIVGAGTMLVERVTGRLSYPKVALAGAMSGMWFGLMVGILLSLYSSDQPMLPTIMAAVLLGAAFGMLFRVLSYAVNRRQRDFTSLSTLAANHYVIMCTPPANPSEVHDLMRQAPATIIWRQPTNLADAFDPRHGTTPVGGCFGPRPGEPQLPHHQFPQQPTAGPEHAPGNQATTTHETASHSAAPAGPSPQSPTPNDTDATAGQTAAPTAQEPSPGLTYGEAIDRQRAKAREQRNQGTDQPAE